MTPLHLKLLLHAFTHAEPWPHNGGCALEYEQHLVSAGLVQKSEDGDYYECTQQGRAHIVQLSNIPLPTQKWVGADGKIIADGHL